MLVVLAFIAVLIAAFFAYKTASDNGRNGPLWALATFGLAPRFEITEG